MKTMVQMCQDRLIIADNQCMSAPQIDLHKKLLLRILRTTITP
jgi:hypothetical protein